MDTVIYLPWTLDSDKQTMCFVFWRYMVSALHIYSYFWSFNPSRRLLDEEIEPGLWHSRWNQVMHGVTRANSGNPQCFLYSLDNWTQEPAVRPDNWIWLMQLSPGNAYTFLARTAPRPSWLVPCLGARPLGPLRRDQPCSPSPWCRWSGLWLFDLHFLLLFVCMFVSAGWMELLHLKRSSPSLDCTHRHEFNLLSRI